MFNFEQKDDNYYEKIDRPHPTRNKSQMEIDAQIHTLKLEEQDKKIIPKHEPNIRYDHKVQP